MSHKNVLPFKTPESLDLEILQPGTHLVFVEDNHQELLFIPIDEVLAIDVAEDLEGYGDYDPADFVISVNCTLKDIPVLKYVACSKIYIIQNV